MEGMCGPQMSFVHFVAQNASFLLFSRRSINEKFVCHPLNLKILSDGEKIKNYKKEPTIFFRFSVKHPIKTLVK